MKAQEFIGIIPPIQSSFTKAGDIYPKGIREIVSFTLPHVQGYYPIGTYGCGPLMSIEERKTVLEIIVEEVNGRVPVVAHVGTADTKTTIELAVHAKSIGCAGVGAIAPYYVPHLPEASLFNHFARLIDAVNEDDFPVFLYNNGHYSQNLVSPTLLGRLADYGLRGCKDSSFDLVNFFMYQDAVAKYPDFNVIIGTEAILVAAFEAGATGCVCGMANVYPELLADLYENQIRGERERAMGLQRLVLRLRQITKAGPTVPILHAILRHRGVDAGYPREPYMPIDDELEAKIVQQLKQMKLL
ncbi:MAG: dihydrodipicolinate synthase family protein [Firmicutes bacterium]|nr:dihydrodipicolinate synthase family protein [Bacillota bacterium]